MGTKDGKVGRYSVDIPLNKYDLVDDIFDASAGEIITGITYHNPIIVSTTATGKM